MGDQLLQRRPFQFSLRTFLIVMTVIPALVWACDRSAYRIEDGFLDVEMRYQAVDAEMGSPIAGATVEFFEDSPSAKSVPRLKTDADGFASRVCQDSMCSLAYQRLGIQKRVLRGWRHPMGRAPVRRGL